MWTVCLHWAWHVQGLSSQPPGTWYGSPPHQRVTLGVTSLLGPWFPHLGNGIPGLGGGED